MTNAERHAAIKSLIKKHTEAHTVSRKAARDALIKEGIYTRDGTLRPEFGGKAKKAQSAA